MAKKRTEEAANRWSPGSSHVFDLTGNNPRAWHAWVETLTQAGSKVRYSGAPPRLPGGEELMLATDAVYALLLGYAIECALKGLWVQAGKPIVADGRYIGVTPQGQANRVRDHRLAELARTVLKPAGLEETSSMEFDVLQRLSAFIVFAGRYPIALNASQMVPISVPGRGSQVPGVFLRADFEVAERLLNRFTRALNPFLPPLERKQV